MTTNRTIKKVICGLSLIACAICLLLSRTAYFTEVPMIRIAISLIMVLFGIEQFFDQSFVGMTTSLGVVVCLFRSELGLGNVHFGLILLSFILIGIGLSIIFTNKSYIGYHGKHGKHGSTEYREHDGCFEIDNSFTSKTQYVSIQNMKSGKIDNGLGNLTVYFNGSTLQDSGALLDINNGCGSMTVYFPKNFRVDFHFDNGLGKINVHGESTKDESLPLLTVNVDNGLGAVDLYFMD